jgi:hypothetical protein
MSAPGQNRFAEGNGGRADEKTDAIDPLPSMDIATSKSAQDLEGRDCRSRARLSRISRSNTTCSQQTDIPQNLQTDRPSIEPRQLLRLPPRNSQRENKILLDKNAEAMKSKGRIQWQTEHV